jgi:hypothetical protein
MPQRPEAETVLVVLFPGSSEVRRVDTVPQAGTRLRSEYGEVATVQQVLRSGSVTYTIDCRSQARTARDLAGDLIAHVRAAVRSSRHPQPTVQTKWQLLPRDVVLRKLEQRGDIPPAGHRFYDCEWFLYEAETGGLLSADQLNDSEIRGLTR